MRKILFVFLFTVIGINIFAQTGLPKAQAMFIYNFSRLIEWPSNYKSGPFIIGVLGSSSTFDELESFVMGKNVGTQPISVIKFASSANISNCHILFITFNKTKELPIIVPQLQGRSTLLITEKNNAIENGSAINFTVIDDKLKFEFKPENATKYQIKLSSKLNEMAYKIY
jgi:hypothetical protein